MRRDTQRVVYREFVPGEDGEPDHIICNARMPRRNAERRLAQFNDRKTENTKAKAVVIE